MLQYEWVAQTITTNHEAKLLFEQFEKIKPKVAGFDTETTGLHIIADKPFLFAFGYLCPEEKKGFTYVVDLEETPELARQVIQWWHEKVVECDLYLAHNIKFDLNMMQNIGLEYTAENISDTMFYMRYAHDAVQLKYGGVPLGLKEYAALFIDASAKVHEKQLRVERSATAKYLNVLLRNRLKVCGKPPPEYQAKGYTLGVIQQMFDDKIFEAEDLPPDVKQVYDRWLQMDVPDMIRERMQEALVSADDIPYSMLTRKNVVHYAHLDIVYMLEAYLKTHEVVKARQNERALEYERRIIYPLLEMERVGFAADEAYLEAARKRLKTYILQRRTELCDKVQTYFRVGQHALIKELLAKYFGLKVASTNNDELSILVNKLKREQQNPKAIDFIERLQELRTLEKWYSAYIIRFQKNLKRVNRLYTQINQVGAISGRVSSDFQQFPNDPIKDKDGNELFHPRKIVLAENGLVFLDYSQIELRFQALYTILLEEPDMNLCRAYMPYKCIHEDGTKFDFTKLEHLKRWQEVWYYEENPKQQWKPTDVHGVMTTIATGLKPTDAEFKHERSAIGKRTVFAKNYGARLNRIREMFPNKTYKECEVIDAAYYKAFPGIKKYHHYCYELAKISSYAENLFGVRYYNATGHKLINLLIQGSAAYFLKQKIYEVWKFQKARGFKTQMQMNIHDELSFKWDPEDSTAIFFKLQRLMQRWDDAYIPIVAEMSVTITNWSEKEDVKTPSELHARLSAGPFRKLS